MLRLPMPGETWRQRDNPDRRVEIDRRTTVGEVVYECVGLPMQSGLWLQPTKVFVKEYEFSEEARDEEE